MLKRIVPRVARRARLGVGLGLVNALETLTAAYGDTDKGEHGYLPYYRRHLGPRRRRQEVVFEIGVGGYDSRAASGSLAVWRDYLSRSTIVGLDLHEKDINFGPRVHFVRADQSDPAQLQVAVDRYGPPTVVIDDGSHIGEHIHASFRHLWPLMPSRSLYVIEDLSTSYQPDYGGGYPVPAVSGVALLQQLVDDVQFLDPVFVQRPRWASRPAAVHADVAALHVYPGIAFVEKR